MPLEMTMTAGRSDTAPLRRLSTAMTAVSLILAAAAYVLLAVEIGRGDVTIVQAQTTIVVAIFALAFPTLGFIVLRRQPANAVGWVYLGVGFWQALNMFASDYSNLAFETAAGRWPLAPELSWVAVWAWTPGFVLFCTFGVLLFPDGHLPSRRWRPVVALSIVALSLMALPIAIASWPYRGSVLEVASHQDQPSFPAGSWLDTASALSTVGQVVLLVAMIGAVAGLISRFRRSEAVERQQLKWFTYAAVIDAALLIVWIAPGLGPVPGALSAFVFAPALPVSIGIAIRRYRLYDIDRIIGRTLVYGLLTSLLAGLYAASVGLMQRLSQAATGANSDAAVVLTTLIIVSSFTPLKNRVQHLVDRRFADTGDVPRRLREFTDLLTGSVSPLDPARTLRRFLALIIDACDLAGGRVELVGPDGTQWSTLQGQVEPGSGDPADIARISTAIGHATIQLELWPRAGAAGGSFRDRAAIEAALAAVASELGPPEPSKGA